MAHENDMKFKASVSKAVLGPRPAVCLRALRGCFYAQTASLRTCSKGRVATKPRGFTVWPST